jgi:hypothetical protein
MHLPKTPGDLAKRALDIVDTCNVTRGQRAASYRSFMRWIEYGQPGQDGNSGANSMALANLLYSHIDRLAAHLYSPTDLRFAIEYRNRYQKPFLDRAAVVARQLSREWELNDIDTDWGHGVKEALYFGGVMPKLVPKNSGEGVSYECELVMPWNFGVYNESRNGLEKQEAVVESLQINRHEVWRHIRFMPDAAKLYQRITSHSRSEGSVGMPFSFMREVVSTATLGGAGRGNGRPGGTVAFGSSGGGLQGPTAAIDLFPMYEIWVKDDDRGDDYTTIQVIAPDIVITPRDAYRRNLFCAGHLPYGLIQPNVQKGYFWGRSEIVDLMRLQDWLTEHLEDTRRLVQMLVEKFIGFEGIDSITDELYGQMRRPGYVSVPQGGKIHDLTPAFPAEMIPIINTILSMMDRVSGFPPIMSGAGEPGVRAGVHADTLMRTGSPRLRDRSLLVERQCAAFGDLTLTAMRENDGRFYWADPDNDEDRFLIADLPDDTLVSVDSHSGSPIYHDDHANLISWGITRGVLGPEDAIEDLPFSHKDIKLQRAKERAAARQKFMEEHPEAAAPAGGKKRPPLQAV